MLEELIKQSTRSDGRLTPSPALSDYLDKHFPQFSERRTVERAYIAVHGESISICVEGRPKTFISYTKGYSPTCGTKGCQCGKTAARSANRSEINKASRIKWQEKTGLKSPSQLPGVGDKISESTKKIGKARSVKIKKTMMERHGVESYLSKTEVHSKGVELAQSDEAREARAATNLERYGVENPLANADIQEKVAKTNLERYGVENPLANAEVREKAAQALLKEYGATNVLSRSSSLYPSIRETILERYGHTIATRNRDVAKKVTFAQIMGTDEEKELFWSNIHSEAWWEVQTRATATDFLKKYVSSPRTIWRHIMRNRPDFATGPSLPQQKVKDYLDSLGIEYLMDYRGLIAPLEVDFYIPSHNLAIEVNGLYWHSESKGKDASYHVGKTDAVNTTGNRLIQFWDIEIYDKWDKVKGIIDSAVGNVTRIHGRKCSVRPLDAPTTRLFLEDNHMQGHVNSSHSYGLYHGSELVCCMTFGKSRFNEAYDWELLRFCTKIGHRVTGGFSKLFRHRPEGSIISYSDRRLFTGATYGANGMTEAGTSRPGYAYTQDYESLESRHRYQKHKLKDVLESFDASLSEVENMNDHGFDRVFDCGNTIWELK